MLSHIVYPAWLKQLDLVSRLDMIPRQSGLARIVSSLPNPSIVDGVKGILPTTQQLNSLLSGIVDALPMYQAIRNLHDVNADSLLSQIERANSAVMAMISSSLGGTRGIDWATILAQPRAMHDLLQAMPKESLRDSLLAEAMLSRFDLPGLACRILGASAATERFAATHVALLSAYADLTEWVPALSGRDEQLREVADYPPRSLLLHADIAEQVSVVEPSTALASEREDHVRYIRSSEDHALPELLDAVDPRLSRLLGGAESALAKREEDWLRHFSISSRELVTHVLHVLAPDEDIRAWTTDTTYFSNGQPTRRARTDFILQKTGSSEDAAYVDAVFRALLATHDLLQKGSHALAAERLEALASTMLGQLKVSLAVLIRVSHMNG